MDMEESPDEVLFSSGLHAIIGVELLFKESL